MRQTTNYELNKPEATDQYNIEHFNDNADIIDTAMKSIRDDLTAEEDASLKKADNLSDLNNKSTAMDNIANSFTDATDANVNDDATFVIGKKTNWFKIKFSSIWNYISGKISSVLGLSTTGYTGNANSASLLQTSRNIDGASFNGTADITHFGVCDTAAATAAKTVTIGSFTGTTLASGAIVYVQFTYANTAATPTLNVSGTGAGTIRWLSGSAPAGDSNTLWAAGETVPFAYNGTYWIMLKTPIQQEMSRLVTNTTAFANTDYIPVATSTGLFGKRTLTKVWEWIKSSIHSYSSITLPYRSAGYFSSPFNTYACYGVTMNTSLILNKWVYFTVYFDSEIGTSWRGVSPFIRITDNTLTYGHRFTFTYFEEGIFGNNGLRFFTVVFKKVNNVVYVLGWDRGNSSIDFHSGCTVTMYYCSNL